jgi:Heterokaryon incompatibility protein (HET)
MDLSGGKSEPGFRGGFRVWLSRLLITVIFGYQFRTPLSLVKKLLLVIFAFLFTLGQISKSSQEAKLSNEPLSIVTLGQSLDYQLWLECIIPSAFIVAWLHGERPYVRVVSLTTCWTLSIVMLTDRATLRAALPFQTLNTPAALFYFLLVFSAAYDSRQHLAEYHRLLKKFFAFIEAEREGTANPNVKSQKEIEQEVASAQASRVAAEATPEAVKRRKEYIEWTNSVNYEPLSGDEIRLLELLPTTDSDGAKLRCHLKNVSMASAENTYTAVSYCWGTNPQVRRIAIEEVEVRVTANLYDALSELRVLGIRLLWVDALCINQRDWHERGAQVLRMSAIYKKAKEVVIWLGTEDSESKRVMKLLKTLTADANVACPNIASRDGRDGPSLDDFKAFSARPYWRRVWIIQEVAAASQVSIVCCGERVAWDQLCRLVNDMIGYKQISPSHWPRFNEELRLIKNISDIREGRIRNTPLSLLEALAQTKASMSTIPHDKVFGLLGLAIDQHHFGDAPDYKMEKKEFCKKMTQSFIWSKQNLDIILAGPPRTPISKLPSWCPNYLDVAEQPLDHHFVKYLSGNYKRHRLGKEGLYWKTTEQSRAVETISFWLEGDLLRVMGLPLGRIDGLGPTTTGENERRTSLTRRDTDSLGRRSSDALDRSYSTYDGLCRMLLVYDKKYSKFTNAPILLGMLYNYAYKVFAVLSAGDVNKAGDVDTVRQWLIANRDFTIHGRKLGDRAWFSFRPIANYFKGYFKQKTTTMTILDYRHVTKPIADIVKEGLHLMTTSKGAVGWAHPEATVDDEIFLFAGCSVPVILRRRPGQEGYHVVGHAYVDGCMDGEKWRERDPSTLVEVNIW